MKALAFLFVMASAATSFANCPNFAGKYQTVDSENQAITLTIEQNACAEMDFTYDYGKGVVFGKTMVLDGKQRSAVDFPSYKSTEANHWDGNVVVIDGVVDNIQYNEKSTYKGKTYLNSEGAIVEEVQNFDDKGNPTWEAHAIYSRIAK